MSTAFFFLKYCGSARHRHSTPTANAATPQRAPTLRPHAIERRISVRTNHEWHVTVLKCSAPGLLIERRCHWQWPPNLSTWSFLSTPLSAWALPLRVRTHQCEQPEGPRWGYIPHSDAARRAGRRGCRGPAGPRITHASYGADPRPGARDAYKKGEDPRKARAAPWHAPEAGVKYAYAHGISRCAQSTASRFRPIQV